MVVQFDIGKFRSSRPEDLFFVKRKYPQIKRIISLQSGFYELLTETLRETQAPHEFGMEYYSVGMSDFLPPDPDDVWRAIDLLKAPKPALVHCMSGVDRTGFVVAVYRMHVQGWSFERAHNEWVKMGRHWWYFWWKYSLKKYERKTV